MIRNLKRTCLVCTLPIRLQYTIAEHLGNLGRLLITVVLLYFDTMQSVSTFEGEVRNLLSVLETCSMDSLGYQNCSKSVSTFKSANTLVLCQSKATLPTMHNIL